MTKIALALALVFGTASVAMAASKHPVHHTRTQIGQQVPPAGYGSYAQVHTTGTTVEPTYMSIQDQDWGY
jgi:hypothetical protein